MGGFAGVNNHKSYDSDAEEEAKKIKRAIYDKITKNFNVFEFLD